MLGIVDFLVRLMMVCGSAPFDPIDRVQDSVENLATPQKRRNNAFHPGACCWEEGRLALTLHTTIVFLLLPIEYERGRRHNWLSLIFEHGESGGEKVDETCSGLPSTRAWASLG